MNALRWMACMVLGLAFVAPGFAQDARAVIEGQAGRDAQGRVAINQASGVGNAQANEAALAFATGEAWASVGHAAQASGAMPVNDARAALQGDALGNTRGLLGVNQAAGNGNTQFNAFVMDQSAHAPQLVDDGALALRVGTPPTEGAGITSPTHREARIDGGALRGGSGVVQVNQTAGVGNASTNAIVLRLPGGTH